MAEQFHNIDPVYDSNSRILILGSFPSVKSRETQFFYGHPRNRFWNVLAGVLKQPAPVSIPEKKLFLLKNGVSLWDVIASCDIEGSSDSSIHNVVPNDLTRILDSAPIRQIFCNGAKSHQLYKKYCQPITGRTAIKLPSTSPANAAFSTELLMERWETLRSFI